MLSRNSFNTYRKTSCGVEEGSLYPALHCLERNGWIKGNWGLSANHRRARFYRLTLVGRKQLNGETERYRQVTSAIAGVMGTVRGASEHEHKSPACHTSLAILAAPRRTARAAARRMEFHVDSLAGDLIGQGVPGAGRAPRFALCPSLDPVWIASFARDGAGLSGETIPVGHLVNLRDHNRSFPDVAAYYSFYGVGTASLPATASRNA
jgi:hypothetical protein